MNPVKCCNPVVIARFVAEDLAQVGLRHRGVSCVGAVTGLDPDLWYQGILLPNGDDWKSE